MSLYGVPSSVVLNVKIPSEQFDCVHTRLLALYIQTYVLLGPASVWHVRVILSPLLAINIIGSVETMSFGETTKSKKN